MCVSSCFLNQNCSFSCHQLPEFNNTMKSEFLPKHDKNSILHIFTALIRCVWLSVSLRLFPPRMIIFL